jgi:hypothetical protein
MMRHHPVYHENYDLVAVKTFKPRPISVFTTIPAILSSNSLTLDKGRKSEGQTDANHTIKFATATSANWSARSLHVTVLG